MNSQRFITSSCLIAGNKVFRNGQMIFNQSGPAKDFLDSTYTHFGINYPKFHKMDMLCKLGFLAAELLLKDTGHGEKYKEDETGVVLSNSHASLDVDLKYIKTMDAGPSPALFVYTLPNIVIGEIAIRHHFKGENAFFVFRNFDGNFITGYVNGLIDQHLVTNCICGWVDIFNEDYRALLFLVESTHSKNAIPFTADHMNQLNQQDHG